MLQTSVKKQNGFTLIELMIVVAVIGILSAIAYPSYQQHILKGYRAQAQAEMMDIANREQQFLLANRVYVAISTAAPIATFYTPPASLTGRYTYAVTINAAGAVPSYTITFTAAGQQANDKAGGVAIATLGLTNQGIKTPSAAW